MNSSIGADVNVLHCTDAFHPSFFPFMPLFHYLPYEAESCPMCGRALTCSARSSGTLVHRRNNRWWCWLLALCAAEPMIYTCCIFHWNQCLSWKMWGAGSGDCSKKVLMALTGFSRGLLITLPVAQESYFSSEACVHNLRGKNKRQHDIPPN